MITFVYLIAFGAIYHLWNSPNTNLFWLEVGLTILMFWVVATIHTATKDAIREKPYLVNYTPIMLVRVVPVISFWTRASMVVAASLSILSIYALFN